MITSQDFSSLLSQAGEFDTRPAIAIAVSGGADSMALVLLANQWAKQTNNHIIALSVDHYLRPESTKECQTVHQWLGSRGIEHHILSWQHEGIVPKTGIQQKAREARYTLLQEWCLAHGVKTLMTAHHAEDQVETFLQRLSKGSGLKGLCGIRPLTRRPFGQIVRPLLTVTPEELNETLASFGQDYVKDPSNANTQFNRIRWRNLKPQLNELGLNPYSILSTIDRFSEVQDYIDFLKDKAFLNIVQMDSLGFLSIDLDKFRFLNPLIAKEVLSSCLLLIGRNSYALKREALNALYAQILEDSPLHPLTIGGCYLLPKKTELRVIRELAAIEDTLQIEKNGDYSWDKRFLIKVDVPDDFFNVPLILKAVGKEGSRHLRQKNHSLDLPHEAILTTLPGVWRQGKMVGIPPLRLITKENQNDFSKLSFTSKTILSDI